MNIYVTKTFMPPQEEYSYYLDQIWQRGMITNQGPLLLELEKKLSKFLKAPYFHFLQNGTVSLQLALSILDNNDSDKKNEIITTPFSYVATSSSILWQKYKPIFVDIEASHFTLNAKLVEEAISPRTKAIMPVHVFGYACEVDALAAIAEAFNIPLIYDGAHAFGVQYKNKSLLSYGDISTLSFHATKLFHTVEGGACLINGNNAKKMSAKLEHRKKFGHSGDKHLMLGINAKNSEFHAAMGLANFPYIEEIIAKRKLVCELYDSLLQKEYLDEGTLSNIQAPLSRPIAQVNVTQNYAYYPVLLRDETLLLNVLQALKEEKVFPRRYFYPSLNTLSYVDYTPCPRSENISSRIICLPLYPDLSEEHICRIAKTINQVL